VPLHLQARVKQVLDAGHGVVHGVLDVRHRLLHGVGGALHRIDDVMFQRLEFFRQGGPGFVHLRAGYFGLVVHFRFSLNALNDWSDSGLNDSNFLTPA
jgi:hypothetical protein